MMAYGYYDRDANSFLPNSEVSSAFDSKPSQFKDRIDIRIKSFKDGGLYGYSELIILKDSENNILEESHKVLLDIEPGTPFGLISNYVDLDYSKDRYKPVENVKYWRSKENESFYLWGNNKSFPFDSYVYGVELTVRYFDGIGSSYKELNNLAEAVFIDLPYNFNVSSVKYYEELDSYFDGKYFGGMKGKIKEGKHWFIIERASWYKWFVLFVLSFLLVPVYILLVSESNAPSLEIMSGMLSVLAVRTILLGDIKDFSIFLVDILFLIVILLIAIIPLIKIYVRQRNVI